MAVINKWSVTSAVELLIPAMTLMVQDDDATDILVGYIADGVRFSNWGGTCKVDVVSNQAGCAETYNVIYSAVHWPKSDSVLISNVQYNRSDLFKMCKEIYDFIQVQSKDVQ